MDHFACYEILRVRPGAAMPEIHRAYKRLALRYHPDRAGGDAQCREAFCRITEAYATLQKVFDLKAQDGVNGACPRCGDVERLFKGVDGKMSCAACLLAQRRKLLPMPGMKTVRCLLSIALQGAAIYCLVISLMHQSVTAALAGLGMLLAALAALTCDVMTSLIVAPRRNPGPRG